MSLQTIRRLIKRLEARIERKLKKKSARVPSWREFDGAATRQRARNLHSAYGKLAPDLPGRMLSEKELAMLEADTDKRREEDADIVERYRKGHRLSDGEIAADADAARRRLRLMVRVGTGDMMGQG